MKYSIFYMLILVFMMGSCKHEGSENTKGDTITDNQKLDSLPVQEDQNYYVSAESGLNYRQRPKEKIIGKFPLNTIVSVVERTGVFQDITDEEKVIHGEWVGVKKDTNTVYIFDGFLSKEKIFLDENITKFIVDYYNDNYGKETILVETKGDSLRNLAYYAKPEYEGEAHGFGQMFADIPRLANEQHIYYGDLNNDGAEDIIVPVNTEGGGGGGNVWWVDLFVFLKQDSHYKFLVTETNWGLPGCTNNGFMFITKIENNIIYGESLCYAEDDGRCCPSLRFNVTLKLENKDFVLVSKEEIIKEKE